MNCSIRKGRTGGGVCIFVNNQIDSFEILDSDLCNIEVQQIWCGINLKSEVILTGCLYRPPGNNISDDKIIDAIRMSNKLLEYSKYSGIILCGDFNCPKINWNERSGATPLGVDSFEYRLVECLDDCYFFQNVLEPTFITSNNRKSLLDLIITENPDRIYNITHGPLKGSLDT